MAVTQRVINCAGRKPFAVLGLRTLMTGASTNKIVTTTNMKVGAYTIAAQPTAPTLITVSTTAVGTADTQGIITVVGTMLGQTITDVITPVAGSTVTGTKYFDTVTSVTGSGWVIDAGAGNDTIVVGVPAAAGIHAPGMAVSFYIVSGNVWFDPIDTAVADTTSLPLIAGDSVELMTVADTMSLIADGSGGTFFAIVYDPQYR